MALDTSQEHHVRIEDKKGKETISKLYYHRECWREIMTGKAALANLQKEARNIMDQFKGIMGGNEFVIE